MPSGSTMARIVSRGRLVVGVDQNNFGFGFRDPKTGDLVGFEIDLAREIARAIFGDPNKVQFLAIGTGDRERAVLPDAEGKSLADLVVRSMTMNCDRWQRVAFSTEYFTARQAVLVPIGSPIKRISQLAGQRVCASQNSTSIRNFAAKVPNAETVGAADALDCLVLLQQNQVVAVTSDDAILAGFTAQDTNTTLLSERFSDEPYGMIMSPKNTDLVRFVNGVLEQVRADGTWTRLYDKWLTRLGATPAPPVARYQS
jgi:polar amino acid transport system substrate-binding protein